MAGYQRSDPENRNVTSFLAQIDESIKNDARRHELESLAEKKGADVKTVLELLAVYGCLGYKDAFTGLADRMMNVTNVPPCVFLDLARTCDDARRPDVGADAYRRYLMSYPSDWRTWIELATRQHENGQQEEALASVKKAVEIGGDDARQALCGVGCSRLWRLRESRQFQALVRPTTPPDAPPRRTSGN